MDLVHATHYVTTCYEWAIHATPAASGRMSCWSLLVVVLLPGAALLTLEYNYSGPSSSASARKRESASRHRHGKRCNADGGSSAVASLQYSCFRSESRQRLFESFTLAPRPAGIRAPETFRLEKLARPSGARRRRTFAMC